jgi:CyaY protein
MSSPMKDEQEFKKHAEKALAALYRLLGSASEDYDFDVDMQDGALVVEFEQPPAKFVISPNAPAGQIWISAHATSYKLDWDLVRNGFVLAATDHTLVSLMEELLTKQVGQGVEL